MREIRLVSHTLMDWPRYAPKTCALPTSVAVGVEYRLYSVLISLLSTQAASSAKVILTCKPIVVRSSGLLHHQQRSPSTMRHILIEKKINLFFRPIIVSLVFAGQSDAQSRLTRVYSSVFINSLQRVIRQPSLQSREENSALLRASDTARS